MSNDKDPRTTRYIHTATTESMGAVTDAKLQSARDALPKFAGQARTIVDLDERQEQRMVAMLVTIQEESRARESRANDRFGALENRMASIESDVHSAKSVSGHSLETAADASRGLIAVREAQAELVATVAELKKQPAAIQQAGADAGIEIAGLIADLRAAVKKWGRIAAIVTPLIVGAAGYLTSRGTAKEAANEAVQSAPKPAERIVVIQQPTPVAQPAASQTGAP